MVVSPAGNDRLKGERFWLAEGFHRLGAARDAGFGEVACDVRSGALRDAILHSVGANATHGVRRSNADKRRAVMLLLKDEQWAKWNDSEIGRRCAVDHKTVARVRAEYLGNSQDAPRTVDRGGKVYTMDTGRIGRQAEAAPPEGPPAAEPAPALPDAGNVVRLGPRPAVISPCLYCCRGSGEMLAVQPQENAVLWRYVLTALFIGACQAQAAEGLNPECRWSKAMRSDQTLTCPGDDAKKAEPAAAMDALLGKRTPALIQEDPQIPYHDVDGSCAKNSGGPLYLAACVRQEQASYEMVKLLWRTASNNAKRESIRYAQSSGNDKAFYNLMEVWLQKVARDEREAADRAAPPRFQR